MFWFSHLGHFCNFINSDAPQFNLREAVPYFSSEQNPKSNAAAKLLKRCRKSAASSCSTDRETYSSARQKATHLVIPAIADIGPLIKVLQKTLSLIIS
ncbi:hypothetical protein V202x_44630 [Gimesia aquarii]|uniref:Uncharacterized protein n=1 Tax=Gimesia aquarii TaxID=2527964 RepID=A0A517X0K8_9PLAN|nr:hypothetical protein V202x_44630 [Gimesia aquarii]